MQRTESIDATPAFDTAGAANATAAPGERPALLDWPLDSLNLIEASAGTGKTWTICGLVLRLLIEARRPVSELLVVTFTTAATAELKERVRARLAAMQRALRDATQGSATSPADPFIAHYIALLASGAREASLADALERVDAALHRFDEAAIFTIHGFCQRALAEAPFAAGLPFAFEVLQSDHHLVHRIATDFMRQFIAGAKHSTDLAVRLHERFTVERLTKLLGQRLERPLDRLEFGAPGQSAAPPDIDTAVAQAEPALAAYRTVFEQARALWQAGSEGVRALLAERLPDLNGNSYRPATLAKAFAVADAVFASPWATSLDDDSDLRYLRAGHLRDKTKKGVARGAPGHPLFDTLETLNELAGTAAAAVQRVELALIRRLLEDAPRELRVLKQRQRVIAYNDMLGNLRAALANPQLAWLAAALRRRYPVALIDEFQDTDPLQFEIFSRIYGLGAQAAETAAEGAHGDALFLVGDPKQSIYRFRGADLFTYLEAAGGARRRFDLVVNQRSVPALIAVQNAVFMRNHRAFALAGLDYHPVQAAARARAVLADPASAAALHLWTLPDPALPRGACEELIIAHTAAEIARLVDGAAAGEIRLGERPLAAGDIAVIVRGHRQGRAVKEALARLGIASVERTQDSVWASAEAAVIATFLRALAEPHQNRFLNACLASELFGMDAQALYALNLDESQRAHHLARFADWRTLLQQRGFGPLWHQVLAETRLIERLLARDNGDRRITNYLHLAELLHAGAEQSGRSAGGGDGGGGGADGLLRYLETERAALASARSGGEEAQLRLESDEHLVQIATIHASKGLEYAVTFCPFLWFENERDKDEKLRYNFHDDDLHPVTRFAADDAEALLRERVEAFAESVRTLYVALTRAAHRIYLVAGLARRGRAKDEEKATLRTRASALNWLVAGGAHDPRAWLDAPADSASIGAAWTDFAQGLGDAAAITPLATRPVAGPRPAAPPAASPAGAPAHTPMARAPQRPVPAGWTMASFTSMTRNAWQGRHRADGATERDDSADHDALQADAMPAAADSAGVDRTARWNDFTPATADDSDPVLALPRGAAAGSLLHAVFEHADLARPATWPGAIELACRRMPLVPEPPGLRAGLTKALEQVARADLDGRGASFVGAASAAAADAGFTRLNELEFCLPAAAVDPQRLARLLTDAGHPVRLQESQRIDGYLRGTIDAIFRLGGRWCLADWKSNHLGNRQGDYCGAALAEAMAEGAYTLQYALYTLALHRYLRLRVPGYDYERDFGSVFYVFVRGTRPDWRQADGSSAGIHRARLDAALIDRLDDLFRQGGGAA